MRQLEGKVAIVTGAAADAARGIVLRFASEGARVAVADTDGTAVEAIAREARERRTETLAKETDVARPAQVDALFAATLAAFGSVDVLVNVVSIGELSPALLARGMQGVSLAMSGGAAMSLWASRDLSDREWRRMVDVHLSGTFHCARAALRIMPRTRGGAIINIASTNGLDAVPGLPHYSVAKWGIIAFTKAISNEVAESGIRINAITDGALGIATMGRSNAVDGMFLPFGAVGPLSMPTDMAGVAAFLASDNAAHVTGQVINPNGLPGV